MSEKIFKGKYQWAVVCALFLIACGVKGYCMAQRHYHVVFSRELFVGYDLAEKFSISTVLQRVFSGCDCTLGSMRPFLTTLLYFLTFKGFGYQPQVGWIMGIVVGSLLVPLYFLVVNAMVNVEVALASSLMLSWMSNYIWQSVALTAIIFGILFIVAALLAAARYDRQGGVGYLYLSGCLISLSVFCRYENAILVPAFVGYAYLFDKEERKWSPKFAYGLLCVSSSLYILFCNNHVFRDPFHMIRQQIVGAMLRHNVVPARWSTAFGMVGELLSKLWSPLLWGAAVAGTAIMVVRHKLKAIWMFLGALSLPLFLIYKVKKGTLDFDENYFFLLALIALPVGLECVRALSVRLVRRRSCGMIILGVAVFCSIVSFHGINRLSSDGRWLYPDKLIRVTEDLESIPDAAALYIEDAVHLIGIDSQTVLVYLKRNPVRYLYIPGKMVPPETEYYLLTSKERTALSPQRGRVKVRDYQAYGFDGLALYRITQFPKEN